MGLIFLIGPRGSGKSSIGKLLALELKCAFLDTDDLVINKINQSISSFVEKNGWPLFRAKESKALFESVKLLTEEDQGTMQGTMQGAVQGTMQGAVQGTMQGTVQGAVQGTEQGAMQGAVQGTMQGAVQGTMQGAVQGTMQGAVQGTMQGVVQGTVQGIIATGGGIVLCPENRAFMKNSGTVVFLDIPVAEQIERLSKADNYNRPSLTKLSFEDEIRKINEERRDLYLDASHYALNVADAPKEAVKKLMKLLFQVAK